MFKLFLYICLLYSPFHASTTPTPVPSVKVVKTVPFTPVKDRAHITTTPFTSPSSPETRVTVRSTLSIPDDRSRAFIFYHSTFPVDGLNPALWREDQNGQLVLAGLSYCSGCLCYSFDHRHPVSFITEAQLEDESRGELIRSLMISPSNMQAIAYRSNLFKSNNHESTLTGNLMELFGCEEQVMRSFYADDFKNAKRMQELMVSDFRAAHHQQQYEEYLAQVEAYEAQYEFKISEQVKGTSRKEVENELNRRAREVSQRINSL